MTITQFITELPAVPDPATDTPEEFSTKAAAFVLGQKGMSTELGVVIPQINATAVQMNVDAANSDSSADAAAASAASAAASAASAIAAPGTNATSTTSLAVGSGSKSLTIQTGKSFAPGMWMNCVRTADRTQRMLGYIDSYNSGTGALVLVVAAADINGSGTYTDWTLTPSSIRGSIFNAVDLSMLGPSIRPSLLCSFANSKSVDPRFTYTMTDALTYFDAIGVLRTAAPGQIVLDHDPATGRCRGIPHWELRTNSIRNNTMQGAVVGTPGTLPTNWDTYSNVTGISTQVVSFGQDNGIDFIDIRFYGTPSAAGVFDLHPDGSGTTVASNSQTWSYSQYVKLVAGSLANVGSTQAVIDQWNGSAHTVVAASAFVPTSAALATQRPSTTGTTNSSGISGVLAYARLVLSGGAIDVTLRFGLPQNELGPTSSTGPTAAIKTTSAAASRAVATLVMPTSSDWFNAFEGTLYVEYEKAFTSYAGCMVSLQKSGADTDFIQLRDGNALGGSPGSPDAYIASGAVTTVDTSSAATANGTRHIIAVAYKANDVVVAVDGSVVATDSSVTMPVGINQLTVGTSGGNLVQNPFNGWIPQIGYFPRRLPTDAEVAAITTL